MMMRIDTDLLKEGGRTLAFEEPADRFPGLREMVHTGECEFTSPIRTRLRAARIREMVEVEGVVQTAARLTCGRCLTAFICPLAIEFALTYTGDRPGAPTTVEPEAKELDASDVGLIYFRGDESDLTEGIQEQVILAFPLRPLCAADCKGLCARCGADLNHESCRCTRLRLKALSRLSAGSSGADDDRGEAMLTIRPQPGRCYER